MNYLILIIFIFTSEDVILYFHSQDQFRFIARFISCKGKVYMNYFRFNNFNKRKVFIGKFRYFITIICVECCNFITDIFLSLY